MTGSLISKKEAWSACQELLIGSNKEAWVVHEDAQDFYRKQQKLCIIAKPVNPKHQPQSEMRLALPRIWKMEGRVEGRSNGYGTVSFFFKELEDLNTVMGNAPYRFKGWMVCVDLGMNYLYPTYLKKIPFRIRILNLPDKYRRKKLVESIASNFGWVYCDSIQFTDPAPGKPAEVWVKVKFDADAQITLARTVRVLNYEPTVDLGFRYEGLLKFCTSCGSLCHASVDCGNRLSPMEEENQALHICQVTGYDENVCNITRVSSFLGYTHARRGSPMDGVSSGGNLDCAADTRYDASARVPGSMAADTAATRSPKRKGTDFEDIGFSEPSDDYEDISSSADTDPSTGAYMGLDESAEALVSTP